MATGIIGPQPQHQFEVFINVSNIGNTLKRFGQPDVVKGGEAESRWSVAMGG